LPRFVSNDCIRLERCAAGCAVLLNDIYENEERAFSKILPIVLNRLGNFDVGNVALQKTIGDNAQRQH
jgi:hypothetical protein